jgi:hypothetical protein
MAHMAIDEPDRIDFIATRPGSSEVLLVISDHLDWDDPHGHALALQTKIDRYLAFLDSGQLRRVSKPPIPDNPSICIKVRALHEAPAEVSDFLARVKTFLSAQQIRFEYSAAAT